VIDKARGSSSLDEDPDPQAEIEPPAPLRTMHRPPIIFRWAANGGYAILLVIMAVLPSTLTGVGSFFPDWLAHAVAYGIQMTLVYWAAVPSLGHRRSLAVGVVAAGVFGVVTECLQFLQPARTVELKDLAANAVGALIFCGVIAGVGRKRARRVP
jgi:VanZ family protein